MASTAGKTKTSSESPVAMDDSAVRVLRQFRQIFNSVKSHFQRMERTSGLGGSQIWALSVIQERPNLGVTELAQAMDIRQSTASNLVKALVERELLVVNKHPGDRRAVQLVVMPAARRLLRRAPGPLVGILPMALGMLEKTHVEAARERPLATAPPAQCRRQVCASAARRPVSAPCTPAEPQPPGTRPSPSTRTR